jgi:Glycosyl hydrolase family 115/Gylcosyl hydrolase family 115 C-terminal domain/Glycosyl hydrolase family 67 N-terminus
MQCNRHAYFALIAVVFLLTVFQGRIFADESFVQWTENSGSFPIASGDRVASICIDASDWLGVARAARDLRDDIQRVTGKELALETAFDKLFGQHSVIVGTLGHSPAIDQLVKGDKLDVSAIRGKLESYLIEVVPNPVAGVDSALVIVGSDKRGTIYGVYDLSQQIGVSPWYWWADVPTEHHDNIFVKPGKYTQGSPAVKYRGIFLNDEAPALSGWVREKYGQAKQSQDPPVPAGVANMNHEFYGRVFELLLRLRGNYLWPAMWNNAFNEDDPENSKLADEYGIVMGTSHQEPMLRAQKEWDRRFRSQRWNYYTDPKTLQDFWREGVARNKNDESILTIGLRGANDTPMIPGGTPEQSAELLKKIIADQRQMISEVINPDPSKVPQLWCPYKEVLEYYDRLGLRVPDDVTILWPDDNWGNLRRLPSAEERKNSGGAGIYYHFDYVGGPRNYKWINTNPLPKVWEQMTQALEYKADRIWIVNVGDLKPLELPISFFMKLAWDGKKLTQDQVASFTRDWATQQFGSEHAAEIAELLAKFGKYAGRRKHELIDPTTFSVVNYNEGDRVVADWTELTSRAEMLSQKLPAEKQDAFFELVLHPIKASSILTEMYVAAAKNKLYAAQGRASTNDWAKKVHELFQADQDLSDYYNQKLAGGKWSHMMDQKHIGYTTWQEPPRNNMPLVKEIAVPEAASMAIAVEGESAALDTTQMTRPTITFDTFNRQSRWIDIINRGQTPFDFSITPEADWIKVSQSPGTVQTERRIQVAIDWDKAPSGAAKSSIRIAGAGGDVVVNINAFKPAELSRDSVDGFVESDGCVSIEAEHYTKKIDAPSAKWEKLDDFGRTLSAMTIFPMTAESVLPPVGSPCLEYRMYLFDSGPLEVQAILSPTLEFLPGRKLRYAVSFDDQAPQIMSALPEGRNRDNLPRDWDTSVKDAVRLSKSKHTLDKPSYHTLKLWMVDPAVVLEKIVVDCGGVKPSYLGPTESYGAVSAGTRAH